MESSVLVEIRNSDGCNLWFISSIYLFIMRSLIFIPLFTVDKAGKFLP